jgi:Skp family chaperone for outer membrane proteins
MGAAAVSAVPAVKHGPGPCFRLSFVLWLALVFSPFMAGAQGLAGVPLSMGQDVSVPRAPLLTIDRDVLYRDSAYGQRLQEDLLSASLDLAAENRRIEAELAAKEEELTLQRADLSLQDFRVLADAFDVRVTRLRAEQEAKARALQRRRDLERQSFFAAALPVLAEIVKEAGAVAILDRSSLFLAAEEIDITELAIRRMDAALGEGAMLGQGDPDATIRPAPKPRLGGRPNAEAGDGSDAVGPIEAPRPGPRD